MDAFRPLLGKLATGAPLTRAEAESAFDHLLSGEVTPAQTGAFLMGLRVRGETVDELTGAVAAMRAKGLMLRQRIHLESQHCTGQLVLDLTQWYSCC